MLRPNVPPRRPRLNAHGRRRAAAMAALVLSAALLVPACGASEPEVGKALQLSDVVSGWFDAGIVNGENKLVPTVSFRIKNVADRSISGVDVNGVFRVVDDPQQLGSKFVKGIDRSGLQPGATAGPFVLKSDLGYSSLAPRTQMLQNSQFKDAQVEIFVKHGSEQWVKLGQYVIDRQLLAR